ncbi:Hypothetical predicted protein [Mytilus galloprovincialis]|uniref:Uncharacterized protein n=1 Tax=Mytilus galloprovincialis TaxID=29158 RepID=A0A8B6GIR4_MYTGA|nr:Hypothetical predicted protein [Mytilus galloprovincialis]
MANSAVRDKKKRKKRKEKKHSKEYKVSRTQKKRNRNTNERKHLEREVKGLIDTMKVARKYIPKHDVEHFKQQTLVKQFVGENYLAHNAIEDVDLLKTLYDSKLTSLVKSEDVFSILYHNCMDFFSDLLSSKIVSRPVCMQLEKDGMSLKHLKLATVRDVNGLNYVLGP